MSQSRTFTLMLCLLASSIRLLADTVFTPTTRLTLQTLAVTADFYDSGHVSEDISHPLVTNGCLGPLGCSTAAASGNAAVGKLGASADTSGSIYAAAGTQAYFDDYITFSGAPTERQLTCWPIRS